MNWTRCMQRKPYLTSPFVPTRLAHPIYRLQCLVHPLTHRLCPAAPIISSARSLYLMHYTCSQRRALLYDATKAADLAQAASRIMAHTAGQFYAANTAPARPATAKVTFTSGQPPLSHRSVLTPDAVTGPGGTDWKWDSPRAQHPPASRLCPSGGAQSARGDQDRPTRSYASSQGDQARLPRWSECFQGDRDQDRHLRSSDMGHHGPPAVQAPPRCWNPEVKSLGACNVDL
jgi:hypothetical protein